MLPKNKIVARLEAQQKTIAVLVIKIICMPTNPARRHWKADLILIGNELAALYLSPRHRTIPRAYAYLYERAFAKIEIAHTALLLDALRVAYPNDLLDDDVAAVHETFKTFLLPFCKAIDEARSVCEIVLAL